MPFDEPKKIAILRILEILKRESNYEHPLKQEDIAKRLQNDYSIELERKAIGRNIAYLVDADIDIEHIDKKGYYYDDNPFTDSELHLLIDAVLGSKHIPAKYAKDLIDKICNLSNKYFRSSVKYIHSINDFNKGGNPSLFSNIEDIDSAIESGRQIHYDYNKYGKDKILHKSSEQTVSPYIMLMHNQGYYLMAYNEKYHNIVFHRVDRITNMQITEETATPIKSIPGYEYGPDYKELSSARPYMYTDKPERIEFIADESIIDQIIDWFGMDVKFTDNNIEGKINVTIKASPNAMKHWAMQYIDHVEIISPEKLRSDIKKSLEKGLEKYK